MAEEIGYGYNDDNPSIGGLSFGLNSGNTRMTKFEFNPNGGKDGTEADCLDIVFTVDTKEIFYRIFPIKRIYSSKGQQITDKTDPEYPAALSKAIKEFNGNITHILSAFISKDALKQLFNVPIKDFKQFIEVAKSGLPPDFDKVILDIFGQYQYTISGDNDKTFVRLPTKVKHGKWICRHIAPVGEWKKSTANGLKYIDDENNVHPFERTSWFMSSNYANQQTLAGLDTIPNVAGNSPGTNPEPNKTIWE